MKVTQNSYGVNLYKFAPTKRSKSFLHRLYDYLVGQYFRGTFCILPKKEKFPFEDFSSITYNKCGKTYKSLQIDILFA